MRDDDDRARRPAPPVNNGIMTTGGTHHVANQAVGDRAQAFSGAVRFDTQDPARQARAAELLALVERLLEEHHAALAEPDTIAREVRRLREELDEDEPQLPVLRRTLDRLTMFAQPVAPLATAVGQLAQLIQGAPGS